MDGRKGIFVTFEGVDGAGKSTQVTGLVRRLRKAGVEVVSLREPGGTPIGEQIRAVLLDPANGDMADECELLLMNASRAQLVRQRVEPALARDAVVICDRFLDSTFAYQHGGRGIDEETTRSCNLLGSCGVVPDLTLVLDLEPQVGLGRATRRRADRLEAEGVGFQARVREGYLTLARLEPGRVRLVDADDDPAVVASRVDSLLCAAFPRLRRVLAPARDGA
ncbi:dTMP kinase [Olsenella massiliensis]|uniref:dTMP kinase n=1 Tax=Olsenella massiliensis TaxID=1622075 RepID=UPI00071C44A9|nr:dTMP kinase [Olsenella massiliensis]